MIEHDWDQGGRSRVKSFRKPDPACVYAREFVFVATYFAELKTA